MGQHVTPGPRVDQADFDVEFRRLREVDLVLLHQWIQRPHVAKWWDGNRPPKTFEQIQAKYRPRLRHDSHIKPYFAWLAGQPIGFIQSYVAAECGDGWWEHETDPSVFGTDQFLSEEGLLGHGIGTRMVTAFVQRLFHDTRATKVQTDPDPTNARAISCYEKVGFRRAQVVDTPAGKALLMFIERGGSAV